MIEGSIELVVLGVAGLAGGLFLLVRGFGSYGHAARIADTSTSRIATLAVGEVRVTGVAEPAELSLVSPLQSAPCLYYRSSISESRDDSTDEVFHEERAVGFRVRDDSGSIRIFPRGARFDVPTRFDERTGTFGEAPTGLRTRTSGAFTAGQPSREAQIAELLTVRAPPATTPALDDTVGGLFGGAVSIGLGSSRRRRYREARIEPGDVVTIVGQALPFDQLPDPAGADVDDHVGSGRLVDDPDTAAALARARATGTLATTAEEAWGNAAIPGFGIGRPVSAPDLDPAALAPELATAEQAAEADRTFRIGSHDLVIAASADVPLLVALGAPDAAAARHEQRFLAGLAGAVLAIASAIGLALILSGGLPR